MEPILYPHHLIQNSSITPNAETNVALACKCSHQSSNNLLNEDAKTRVQRVCDLCVRTLEQNQTSSTTIETKVTQIQNSSNGDDDFLDDYDDEECKRKVRCLQSMVTIGSVCIVTLMAMSYFSEDSACFRA